MIAYRMRADIIDEDGRAAQISLIIRSGAGWRWALEQARGEVADFTLKSDLILEELGEVD